MRIKRLLMVILITFMGAQGYSKKLGGSSDPNSRKNVTGPAMQSTEECAHKSTTPKASKQARLGGKQTTSSGGQVR